MSAHGVGANEQDLIEGADVGIPTSQHLTARRGLKRLLEARPRILCLEAPGDVVERLDRLRLGLCVPDAQDFVLRQTRSGGFGRDRSVNIEP